MPDTLTPNQLVAYNLMRLRKAHGLTQEQAAERVEQYLGSRWSKAVYSAAERSYVNSGRVRQFTADDLTAFAMAFGVPVVYFWLPVRAEDRGGAKGVTGGGQVLAWDELFAVMLGGQPASIVARLDELPDGDGPSASVREVLQLLALTAAGMGYRTVQEVAPPGDTPAPAVREM